MMISEYDRNRFTDALSQSYRSIEPHRLQIHLKCKKLAQPLKTINHEDSEFDKDYDDELFEMQLVQSNWMGKRCVTIYSHLVQTNDYNESTQQLQSQSILHQINDLVLETCYKYERFKNIDICRNLRRVIQIDANDNSGTVVSSQGNHFGFSNKNQFETVDHNKKFYRISLDVNFRNIDTVNLKPKHRTKRLTSEIKKNSALALTSVSTNISDKGQVMQLKKPLDTAIVSDSMSLTSQSKISSNKNFRFNSPNPENQNRLFMTHNKMYIMPVLNEIKEENKSENSESKTLSKNNKSQESCVKKSSIMNAKKVDFSKESINSSSNQPANYKVETIKLIACKL